MLPAGMGQALQSCIMTPSTEHKIRYGNISAHISSHTDEDTALARLWSIKCCCKWQAPKQKSCLQCFDSFGWTSARVFRWRLTREACKIKMLIKVFCVLGGWQEGHLVPRKSRTSNSQRFFQNQAQPRVTSGKTDLLMVWYGIVEFNVPLDTV